MPNASGPLDLEELVITTYAALDDALKHAGLVEEGGKLIPRRGPPPEVSDREVLCLALLQEWLGYESDLSFYQWMESNGIMLSLFPRMLRRQKWVERRTLLTPLIQKLSTAFMEMTPPEDESLPPFSS
jgi:hypothetical protein